MANKLTAKQEAFCQAVFQGKTLIEAYSESYNVSKMSKTSMEREAHLTMQHPKVAARVAELRAVVAERSAITVESLLEELEEARAVAMVGSTNPQTGASSPQAAAAVAATMGKAKLLGFLIDKNELTGKNGEPIKTEGVVSGFGGLAELARMGAQGHESK